MLLCGNFLRYNAFSLELSISPFASICTVFTLIYKNKLPSILLLRHCISEVLMTVRLSAGYLHFYIHYYNYCQPFSSIFTCFLFYLPIVGEEMGSYE
jgi:hypothetical protein